MVRKSHIYLSILSLSYTRQPLLQIAAKIPSHKNQNAASLSTPRAIPSHANRKRREDETEMSNASGIKTHDQQTRISHTPGWGDHRTGLSRVHFGETFRQLGTLCFHVFHDSSVSHRHERFGVSLLWCATGWCTEDCLASGVCRESIKSPALVSLHERRYLFAPQHVAHAGNYIFLRRLL